MIPNEYNHLDKLSVYADLFYLQDEHCMELIRKKIAANTPLTDEDYRIIAVEHLRGIKRLKVGKYAVHVLEDPNGRFTIQAHFNSIPGSTAIPITPTFDHMTPESQQIMERINKTSPYLLFKSSPDLVFKSAFHPDFDNQS